jgi:hypothetical protein
VHSLFDKSPSVPIRPGTGGVRHLKDGSRAQGEKKLGLDKFMEMTPIQLLVSQHGRWIDLSLAGVEMKPLRINMRNVASIQTL